MVDRIDAQSVDFIGDNKVMPKSDDKKLMSLETEDAIVESTKNFNKLVNNMFSVCGKLCIKSFNGLQLNPEEKECVDNCHKKFFHSYAVGERILTLILEEAKKTDLFSDKSEINIINDARKNL